jgi:TetR/AcrR family transcriptional repressor of nem operon
MGSELARGDEHTRVAAYRGFSELIDLVAKRLGSQRSDSTESKAVFSVAAMIGAVTVSRILTDSDASTLVLDHVKEHLNAI